MELLKVLLCVYLCTLFNHTYGLPYTVCQPQRADPYGNFYIADDTNRCQFYWCVGSNFVTFGSGPFAFSCPPTYGTVQGAMGTGRICTEKLVECGAEPVTPSTTTQATTTTTTTTDKSPVVLSSLQGMHVKQGLLQPTFRTVAECLLACVINDDCYGADFNFQFATCWFHNSSNVCSASFEKENCTHYKFVECESTTTPLPRTTTPPPTTTRAPTTIPTTRPSTLPPTTTTTTTTTTTAPPTTRFNPVLDTLEGVNIGGGSKMAQIRDLDRCVDECYLDAACTGLDFDFRDLTCWLHTIESECNRPRVKTGCTHYRIADVCGESTSSGPTAEPYTDDMTTEDNAITTEEARESTTMIDTNAVPNGFYSMIENMHLLRGMPLLTRATLQQCLDACLLQSKCIAVDYDAPAQTCWGFEGDTFCGEPLPMTGTNHYKRAPCINDLDTSKLRELRLKFHKPGGFKVCAGCSLELCMEFCYLTDQCFGIDYDSRDKGCYMHTEESACAIPMPKDYCVHYSFTDCGAGGSNNTSNGDNDNDIDGNNEVDQTTIESAVTETVTEVATEPFPAPNDDFIALNFPGPKVLPSGWQAYPAMQVNDGTRIATGIDGDQSFNLCDISASCLAVDFNSYDGSCYFFETEDLRCGELLSANLVYHALKPTPCDSYPTPVAIAP